MRPALMANCSWAGAVLAAANRPASAKMSRHENYAATAMETFEIILESVVNDEPRDVGLIQFRKMRELDQ